MKNIIKITVLLFFTLKSFSQNIEINGYFDGAKDSTKIWFNKSVDSNYSNYFFNQEFALTKDGSIKKMLYLLGTGVIMINPSNYNPKIKLILNYGDKISFKVKRENNNFIINFEGNNSQGLNELYNSQYLTRKKLTPIIGDLIPKTNDAKEVISEIENIKSTSLKPFIKLLTEAKITNSFYKTLNLEVDLLFLETTFDIISYYSNDIENFKKQNLSIDELNKVIIEFDKKYNAFDSKYDICDGISRAVVIEKKCDFINKKVLFGEKYDIQLWNDEQSKNNYAPIKCQELVMCNNISIAGFEQADCTYEKFKKIFPNSLYLKSLKRIDYESKLSSKIKLYSFGTYSIESKKITFTDSKEYDELTQLIKGKFKGKAVFVDLWASYCAPCKKEFLFSTDLHTFLNQNNIEILYVSVDNSSQIQKWEKDIYEYELKGNHYFATNKIQSSLKKILNEKNDIFIPRYLLFNSKGELVLKNAKKPSEGVNLYNEILRVL